MTPTSSQHDLLRGLVAASGAREASWVARDRLPVRVVRLGPTCRRPSWRAEGPWWGGQHGPLSWDAQNCARDPLLVAAGIQCLRGWCTPQGGRLLIGGDEGLDAPIRELQLQADALAALESAGGDPRELERLGLTAAGVAHDLRNLLSVAQLEMEAVGLGRPGTELRLRETLREARGVAESFLGDAGAARRQVADLGPVLGRAAERAPEIAHLPRARCVSVRVECPAPCFVLGRADQLARVLDNLVANAVAAASRVPSDREPVVCTVRRAGDRVQVEIADQGPGLSSRDLTRVLAPGRSASGGAGFGTASVRECLELIEARLEIESEPGRGTLCRVSLRGAFCPGTPVVLVVSPDAALRAAWVAALATCNLEGLGVRDAREALAWSDVLELTGVLWARGTPGKGRAELRRSLRERGRPWCDLGVRGPAPRTPGERGAGRVLAHLSGD